MSTNLGFSQYFLYAEVPKTTDTSGGSEDLEKTWTRKFFDDESKDYFIVDPNNGILTTGGIIARYGSIGNWMISK